MSVAMRAVSVSQNTATVSPSPNMKEEELKSGKIESFGSELKKDADFGKELNKEINEKPVVHDEANFEVGDNDARLKSDSELSVDPNKQVEEEKGEESLSKHKLELLGSTDSSAVGADSKGPKVQILSLSVVSPGRKDFVLPTPFRPTTSSDTLFSLKQGSKFRIRFHFTVSNETVKDLKYTYIVWKSGIRVQQTKKMVGTFSPRQEPYTFELEEATIPTGFFARGSFLVRSKFLDDDGNCYLDTTYYFDIRKDWGARDKC